MKDDRTPELLLSVAKVIFAKKGFTGTTVREIAKQAGVNLSLVSYHFNGKEGLYRACIERFTQARLNDAQRVLQPALSPQEFRLRYQLFLSEFLRAFAEEPELSLMVQREIETEGAIIADIFPKTLLKVAETLKVFLLAGKERGWVRADLDPMVAIAATFGTMVHSMRMERVMDKYFHVSVLQPAYREMFSAQLANILLDGVACASEDALKVNALAAATTKEIRDKTKGRLQP